MNPTCADDTFVIPSMAMANRVCKELNWNITFQFFFHKQHHQGERKRLSVSITASF